MAETNFSVSAQDSLLLVKINCMEYEYKITAPRSYAYAHFKY